MKQRPDVYVRWQLRKELARAKAERAIRMAWRCGRTFEGMKQEFVLKNGKFNMPKLNRWWKADQREAGHFAFRYAAEQIISGACP